MEEPLLPLSTPLEGAAPSPVVTARAPAEASITTTATGSHSSPSPPTGNILAGLTSLVFLASISLWANHEASRGFQVTVFNDARGSDAGKMFDLLFVCNDRATKLVLDASSSIEQRLYPDPAAYPKKPVQVVALHLARQNLSGSAVNVSPDENSPAGGFVIEVSPSVVIGPGAAARMTAALYRGMARVWLWDRAAPKAFLDAVAEHVSVSAGSAPEENHHVTSNFPITGTADSIGQLLQYCDGRTREFMPRLNQAMRLRNVWSSYREQLMLSGSLRTTQVESTRLCDPLLEPVETAAPASATATAGGGDISDKVTGPSSQPWRCSSYSCSQ